MSYYAAHHSQVSLGGRLLELSAIFLALLGVAIWARLRASAPVVGVVALVGAAMAAVDAATSGATYRFIADLGWRRAWHQKLSRRGTWSAPGSA